MSAKALNTERRIMINDTKTLVEASDIFFVVYYIYIPGAEPIMHLAPEDCCEGEAYELELTGVYLSLGSQIEDEHDLTEVLKDEVLEEITEKLLEICQCIK